MVQGQNLVRILVWLTVLTIQTQKASLLEAEESFELLGAHAEEICTGRLDIQIWSFSVTHYPGACSQLSVTCDIAENLFNIRACDA